MHISTGTSPKTGQATRQSISEKNKSQTSTPPTLSPRTDATQKKNFLGLDDAFAGIESTLGNNLLGHPAVESLFKVRRNLSELMQHLWTLRVGSPAFKSTCEEAKNDFIKLMFTADYLTLNHEHHKISKSCAQNLNGVMMQVRDKFQMMFAMQLNVWSEKDNRFIADLCTQPEPIQLSHGRPQLTATKRHTNLDDVGTISPRRRNNASLDTADARVLSSPRSPRSVSVRQSDTGNSSISANLTTALSPSTADRSPTRKD